MQAGIYRLSDTANTFVSCDPWRANQFSFLKKNEVFSGAKNPLPSPDNPNCSGAALQARQVLQQGAVLVVESIAGVGRGFSHRGDGVEEVQRGRGFDGQNHVDGGSADGGSGGDETVVAVGAGEGDGGVGADGLVFQPGLGEAGVVDVEQGEVAAGGGGVTDAVELAFGKGAGGQVGDAQAVFGTVLQRETMGTDVGDEVFAELRRADGDAGGADAEVVEAVLGFQDEAGGMVVVFQKAGDGELIFEAVDIGGRGLTGALGLLEGAGAQGAVVVTVGAVV